MKASNFHYQHTLIWLVLVVLAAVAVGCSDEESTNDVTEGPLTITTIILDPKSAVPDDTVKASVIVEGDNLPGSFPSIEWTATDGVFVANNLTTVKWVAPNSSGVVRLTCKATNSAGSTSESADIYIGEKTGVVASNSGEIHLRSTPGDFYYLGGPTGDAGWDSSEVYSFTGGTASRVVTGARLGGQFVFSADLTKAAHAAWGERSTINDEDPIDVFLVDIGAGTQSRLTSDGLPPEGRRHQQYQYPYFSPDGNLLAYQAFLPFPIQGDIDSLDVLVYYILTDETVNATEADSLSERRRNLFPTFSTDYNWLVFVSDRAVESRWDLYGLPITGGVVDTRLASVTRLTTGNMIGLGPAENLSEPFMTWNPNPSQSILALVGANDILNLIQTNASGAITVPVSDIAGNILEMLWSADGQVLAVSVQTVLELNGPVVDALYTVELNGATTLRHTAIVGDVIVDMAWSPNRDFLVYRNMRGANCWFELLDVNGGTPLIAPLVLTASTPVGNRGSFASEMFTNAQYATGDIVYLLEFDAASPAITSLDISNILP